MLELTLRLVFSLAVVVGLLLLLARLGSRRFRGQHGSLVKVLHRQALSRNTSVFVVSVGSRVLVLGSTEQQIQVLTELDPFEVDPTGSVLDGVPVLTGLPSGPLAAPDTARRGPGAHRAELPAAAGDRTPVADGPLAGSVLSPQTWRQALAVATRRAS